MARLRFEPTCKATVERIDNEDNKLDFAKHHGKDGGLYTDKHFPADKSSLWWEGFVTAKEEKMKGVYTKYANYWARPSEIEEKTSGKPVSLWGT